MVRKGNTPWIFILLVGAFLLGSNFFFSTVGDPFMFVNQEGETTFEEGDSLSFVDTGRITFQEMIWQLELDGEVCDRNQDNINYHVLRNPDVPLWSCFRWFTDAPTQNCELTSGWHDVVLKYKDGNPIGTANCRHSSSSGTGNQPFGDGENYEWIQGDFNAPNTHTTTWKTFTQRIFVIPQEVQEAFPEEPIEEEEEPEVEIIFPEESTTPPEDSSDPVTTPVEEEEPEIDEPPEKKPRNLLWVFGIVILVIIAVLIFKKK